MNAIEMSEVLYLQLERAKFAAEATERQILAEVAAAFAEHRPMCNVVGAREWFDDPSTTRVINLALVYAEAFYL